jgi:hypothetical protein
MARIRAGATQMIAYQLVLLQLWLSAAPPAQERSATTQPPAYSQAGRGVCNVFNVAGFKSFESPRSPARWSAAILAQSGTLVYGSSRAEGPRVILPRWLDVFAVLMVTPGLRDHAALAGRAEAGGRHSQGLEEPSLH